MVVGFVDRGCCGHDGFFGEMQREELSAADMVEVSSEREREMMWP